MRSIVPQKFGIGSKTIFFSITEIALELNIQIFRQKYNKQRTAPDCSEKINLRRVLNKMGVYLLDDSRSNRKKGKENSAPIFHNNFSIKKSILKSRLRF